MKLDVEAHEYLRRMLLRKPERSLAVQNDRRSGALGDIIFPPPGLAISRVPSRRRAMRAGASVIVAVTELTASRATVPKAANRTDPARRSGGPTSAGARS